MGTSWEQEEDERHAVEALGQDPGGPTRTGPADRVPDDGAASGRHRSTAA
jgi:hypothetical protein